MSCDFGWEETVYSSKNHSVPWIACCFWLREGSDGPHWMDYQQCGHCFPILYLLRLRIGGYLSTIGSNLSHGHAFTQATALAWNP
jgi:hypothetical protein